MIFALLILPFIGTIGCGSNESNEKPVAEMPEDMEEAVVTEAAQPEMVDGVQVITVKIDDFGYTPNRIAFAPGVPAKIVFDQHGTTKCAWDVMSADLGIALTDLPEGEKTEVTFTPTAAGTYSFTCGMDMMKGTVIVAEA